MAISIKLPLAPGQEASWGSRASWASKTEARPYKTEPAGYGSSTKPVTATRSYPNLASADANHLPKTITEGGRTLKLQDIQWQTDNTYNADDYEIGDRFTAICTYGGSKSVSYVTGYTTTANYTGEVYRTGVTVIRYTVIFTGTPITSVDPEPVAKRDGRL